MQRSMIPFNVTLLNLTPNKLAGLKQITSLTMFEGITRQYHPEGLFSTSIFGRVGDPRRNMIFAYIDVKAEIFHPIIYGILIQLKRLYGGILSGTEYAVWNPVKNDFEASNPMDGETGFHFFAQHWKKIVFTQSESDKRGQMIDVINKYRDTAMTSKILVLPAGLRDVEIGSDGRTKEDEINPIYRQLLGAANTIPDVALRSNPEIVDRSRYTLQLKFNELYAHFERLIYGKNKLIQNKWASRRIMNGTANVITSMNLQTDYLGTKGALGFNNTVIGLFQVAKGLQPMALYLLRTGFLSKVFPDANAPAILIDKKTLKRKEVVLPPAYYDRYQTNEGLEKVLNAFRDESIRDTPLEVEGHYLGLIYKGPDKTFKIIQDIDEVPEHRSKEHVYPLTFCELLYLSGYLNWNNYPAIVTRYPITGVGSIYPSMTYVRTTTTAEKRWELGEDWGPMTDNHCALEFPIPGPYVKSMAPHPAKLDKLGADFDGDTMTCNFIYSDESVKEIKRYFQTKRAYIGIDGHIISSTNVSTVALTLHNLTS